jgi:CheY-like chemotaxis protein
MHTILLADDDNDDAEIFAEALAAVGDGVNFARVDTGFGVFDYLRNKDNATPGIIFLDLNMPEMNGWQCLAKLKNTKEYERIPVIIYTTSSNPRDKEIANDLNAHGLITKPSNPKILEKILSLVVVGIKQDHLKQALKDAYLLSKN